jgi:hypothetical protein
MVVGEDGHLFLRENDLLAPRFAVGAAEPLLLT